MTKEEMETIFRELIDSTYFCALCGKNEDHTSYKKTYDSLL
jgi:hypothetical protein